MQTTHTDRQYCMFIDENVVLPMDVQLVNDHDIALIYATSTARQGLNAGHIYVQFMGQNKKTLQLTEHEGDYGPSTCTQQGKTLWVSHTAYADKHRSLYLHCIQDGRKLYSFILVNPSKIDNPHISICDNHLHITWEDYSSGEAVIKCARYATDRLMTNDSEPFNTPLTVTEEKCYKPQLISDGQQLYLFYEWFFHGRYRLMARCLLPGKTEGPNTFSQSIEVGYENRNDQAVSLAIQGDKVIAVWENSSPLDKGYEWISPNGHKVIIPNFGHGWRVNTKIGLRRVQFIDGTWHLEDLTVLPQQTIETQESAGAPRVHVNGDTLIVSYLRWDYGSASAQRGWEICTKVFDGQRWINVDSPELIQKQRVRPAVILDRARGHIHTFGQSPQHEKSNWSDWTQQNAATFQRTQPLPQLPYAQTAEFKALPCEQRVYSISMAPTRDTPYVTNFEDGKRQLLWGDLHMHSNLSGCSLGSRFHCTELEEKFRFCRDVAHLDFALNTDHDSMLDNEWHRNRNAAHFHDLPGHFVAFNGYEWTCSHFNDKPNYGHYNILYEEDGPMLRTEDPRHNSVMKIFTELSNTSALAIPHHPGDNTHPLDWNAFNPSFSPLVEIFQVRGSYEYDNCPMHPELYGRNVVRKHSLQYGLNRGFDFGFTAGGEHEGVGVTGVYAAEFTRKGIYDALYKRRTYGTTGDRIIVDFRLDGHPMGSCIQSSSPSLSGYLHIIGTDAITSILMFKNGQICQEWNPETLQANQSWEEERSTDSPVPHNRDYYYVVVIQSNGEMAWTSPIFVYST